LFPRSFRGTLSSIGVPALQASLAALSQNAPRANVWSSTHVVPKRTDGAHQVPTCQPGTLASTFPLRDGESRVGCCRASPAAPDTGSLSKLKEVLTVQIRTAWRFEVGVVNGHQLIGVATVGNPVARAFNGRGIVEVNRLCVRRDIASLLCWNAASMLYGAASRAAERAGFQSIITYTHETEDSTSLRAAGWTRNGPAGGRSWHRPGRPRSNRNAFVPKVRWSRTLFPKPALRPIPTLAPAVSPLWIGDGVSAGPYSL